MHYEYLCGNCEFRPFYLVGGRCPRCGDWEHVYRVYPQATPNSPQLKPMHPAVGLALTALVGVILVALVIYSF